MLCMLLANCPRKYIIAILASDSESGTKLKLLQSRSPVLSRAGLHRYVEPIEIKDQCQVNSDEVFYMKLNINSTYNV